MSKERVEREPLNINLALGGHRPNGALGFYDKDRIPKQIDVRRHGSVVHSFEPLRNEAQKEILRKHYCDDIRVGDIITTLIVPEAHRLDDIIIKILPNVAYSGSDTNMQGLKISAYASLIATDKIGKNGKFPVIKVIDKFGNLSGIEADKLQFKGQRIAESESYTQIGTAYEIGFRIDNLPTKVKVSEINGCICTGFGYNRYLPYSG